MALFQEYGGTLHLNCRLTLLMQIRAGPVFPHEWCIAAECIVCLLLRTQLSQQFVFALNYQLARFVTYVAMRLLEKVAIGRNDGIDHLGGILLVRTVKGNVVDAQPFNFGTYFEVFEDCLKRIFAFLKRY